MKKILVILFALASVSGYAAFGLNDAFDDSDLTAAAEFIINVK